MKNILLLVLAILPAFCFSQENINRLKISGLVGSPFYNSENQYGARLQFDRVLNERFTATLATSYSTSDDATFTTRTDVAAMTQFRYDYYNEERTFISDIQFSYALFGTSSRSNLKLGAGLSYVNISFEHPSTITFLDTNPSTIPLVDYDTFQSHLLMYNIFFDYDLDITSRLFLTLNGTVRGTFGEQAVLTQQQFLGDQVVATTRQGVNGNATFALGLGYKF